MFLFLLLLYIKLGIFTFDGQMLGILLCWSFFLLDCRISYIPRRYIHAFKEGLPVPEDDDDVNNEPVTPKTPNRAGIFAATKSRFEMPGTFSSLLVDKMF